MARATDTSARAGQWIREKTRSCAAQLVGPKSRLPESGWPCFILRMLRAIFLLLACQLAGEIIHRLTGLPLPGSVIGMLLLIAWLALVPAERPTLGAVTGWLTAHLSIMFVPAAVGLIDEGPILSRYGLGIVTAVVASTLLTLVVTALVFRWALNRFAPETEA